MGFDFFSFHFNLTVRKCLGQNERYIKFSRYKNNFEQLLKYLKVLFPKMEYLVCLFFFSMVFCELNDFKCGYSDEKMESLEFYYGNFNGTLPINCSSKFLPTRITDVHIVRNLTISGYIFERTEVPRMFQNFPNLYSLDLSYSVDYCDFWTFAMKHQNLVKYKATYSGCTFFNVGNMPKLIEMDLSHNNIRSWWSEYNNTHPGLEFINLSYNLIAERFDNDLLDGYPKLKKLNLENNPIESINCEILSRVKNGLSIYISWNTIEQFNCSNEQRIQVVPTSNVTGLFPSSSSNGGVELHCNDRSFANVSTYKPNGDNILAVELMKCLKKSLKHLHLYGNFTGKLNVKTFEGFLNLEEIEIRTARLENFDFILLKNQKHLKRLLFSKDSLKEMNNLTFLQELKELEYITIMENQLKNTAKIFEYMSTSVKGVSVFGNLIGNFTIKKTLKKFQKIEFISLSNVNLSIIKQYSYFSRTSLDSLHLRIFDISYNNFIKFDFESLQLIFRTLHTFNASYCKIKNSTKLIKFVLGKDLKDLRLSGNHLGQADALTFQRLTNLEYIHLDDMNASNLDIGMLVNLKQLKFLNVSSNNMKTINLNSTTFQNLEELYLDGNDLETFDDLTKDNFPNLKK